MFRALLIKELHDHFVSLRFQAGFMIALVLVTASAAVLSGDYAGKIAERSERERATDQYLSKYGHLNRTGMLQVVEPPPAALLVRGLAPEAGRETLYANPVSELFAPADLSSIVAVVFSLFAAVLGFDSINGERERGTLKLILTNGVRRFDVLAAKWTAGMLVLGCALAASSLAGGAVTLTVARPNWTSGDWLSYGAMCAAALAGSAVFFSLALLLSIVARRSSVSVIATLFAWIVLALVVPQLSPYIAAQFVRIPSVAALERDRDFVLDRERDELGAAAQRKIQAKYKTEFSFGDISTPADKERLAADPALRQAYERMRDEIEAAWAEVNRQQRAKAARMSEEAESRAERQFTLSKKLSYASPVPPLVYAMTELGDSGFAARKRFAQQYRIYSGDALRPYLTRRWKEEQARNPAFGVNDFVDLSTRPRFTYAPAQFSDRLEEVLPYGAMLLAWNFVLLLAAAAAFQRFDVR